MAKFTTLISATELADRIQTNAGDKTSSLRVFDCRFSLMDATVGQTAYAKGHLPNASYAHLNNQLSAPVAPGSGRHPLPDRDVFLAQVRRWGINNTDQVVAYDADTGAYAARFWWMMRWLGHTNVCVLDGGLAAWQEADLELVQDVPVTATSNFQAATPLTRQVDVTALPDENQCVIDARDVNRFRGEVEPIDPVAGHIPGAVCHPFTTNMDAGRFLAVPTLKNKFSELTQSRPTVCYCGSGVTATHNILAMVHAGLPEPALYPGSWSQWVADPSRPVAIGD